MASSKHIGSQAEFDSTLTSVGSKLVVVDFHATWCGPCHAIAPVFESLAKQHTNAVFVKVDVDAVPAVAQKYSVRAMPTFLFIKNKSVVATLQGANPSQLTALVKTHSAPGSFGGSGNTLAGGSGSGAASSGSGTGGIVQGITEGHQSLLSLIDSKNSGCLNESPSHSLSSIVKGASGGKWLESDADEQLIMTLAFTQKVRLSGILLRTTPSAIAQAPKTIKLYANRPSLSFEDAEDDTPTQAIELSEDDVRSGENGGGGKHVQLRFVKFQNVDSVSIAVMSNQGGEETTRIDAFDVFGISSETTNMSDLKKIEAEGEPANLPGGRGPSRTGLKGGSSRSSAPSIRPSSTSERSSSIGGSSGITPTEQAPRRRPSAPRKTSEPQEESGSATPKPSSVRPTTSYVEEEMMREAPSTPVAPPHLGPAHEEVTEADFLAEAISEYKFGGWHYAPLVVALVPPLGAIIGGRADAWTDALLLLFGAFWLYQFLRAPWDIYHAARTRRILQADAVAEEDGEQSPERKRQRALAASELKGAEFVALLCCLLSPLAGAYFLTWMHSALSDGDRYLSSFNIRLFMLASGIKPWMHGFRLLRRRLLLLQEDVHYPSGHVELLSRRLKRLEADLSSLRKGYATKSDVRTLRDGIDAPLTQLSRAVRRYERKEEHLRLSAEEKFVLVESRLEDLLREVAINAELIEEERRERERANSLPMSLVQAIKYALGVHQGRKQQYLQSAPRSLPSAASLGIGPQQHEHGHLAPPPSSAGGPPPPQYARPSYPGPPSSVPSNAVNGSNMSTDNKLAGPNGFPRYSSPSPSVSSERYWFERGPLFWMFLPLSVSNAVVRYASTKVKSVLDSPNKTIYHHSHHQQQQQQREREQQQLHGHQTGGVPAKGQKRIETGK